MILIYETCVLIKFLFIALFKIIAATSPLNCNQNQKSAKFNVLFVTKLFFLINSNPCVSKCNPHFKGLKQLRQTNIIHVPLTISFNRKQFLLLFTNRKNASSNFVQCLHFILNSNVWPTYLSKQSINLKSFERKLIDSGIL